MAELAQESQTERQFIYVTCAQLFMPNILFNLQFGVSFLAVAEIWNRISHWHRVLADS